jgi:DNA-binding response OmpR family regulator
MSEAGGRILIVEDDLPFARSLQRRLAAAGYEVSCASDGREGMRVIVTLEPKLVISDWVMPHVDGLELCRAVKTGLGDAAPFFLLLTSKDDLDARTLALETGADDFVVKPCHPGELLIRVRNGLRQLALRDELLRTRAELDAMHTGADVASELLRVPGPLIFCRPCGKVRVSDGVWEDLAHLVQDAGVMNLEDGLCPDCAESRAQSARGPRSRAA